MFSLDNFEFLLKKILTYKVIQILNQSIFYNYKSSL